MSRNRGEAPKQPVDPHPLPNIPATFTPQWRFKVFPDAVRLALGENDVFHFLHIIPMSSAIELHQKLGEFIAEAIRKRDTSEPQRGRRYNDRMG